MHYCKVCLLYVRHSHRRLFWTDWGSVAKIERASMDGKERTVLIDTELVWPNAITLDYQTQTLYWADANLDKIESSNTDGLFRRVVTKNPLFIQQPFDIDVFDNQLYWSDWNFNVIITLPLSTPSTITAASRVALSTEPMAVRVVAEVRQPIGNQQLLYLVPYIEVFTKCSLDFMQLLTRVLVAMVTAVTCVC